MKLADVSVALLNGYGDERESNENIDFENERRRQKVTEKPIGSNRKSHQIDSDYAHFSSSQAGATPGLGAGICDAAP